MKSQGQSLAEFALVFPVLILILGGIVQFGLIFWGANTLNQVVRDTGRWAASLQMPCVNAPDKNAARAVIIGKANSIAQQSALIGFSGAFPPADVTIDWDGNPCPPTDNLSPPDGTWVRIQINHRVPVFFPVSPGGGAMGASTRFRLEPAP